ncbi:rhodanese-like domain-containing protein [Actinobacillus vicugnae]|uniref:rhodanese-like domain-containing protein n=1 Tax=Actinobacillus vicugnae TaxID=2573093 RepID=UPI00123F8921|nr:rhodanese-like domain-containing protein [Actinobacillus vicugnae]
MLKQTLLTIGTLFLGFSVVSIANERNQQHEKTQVIQAKKAQGIWIDVRSAEEFAEGHIEGTINIPAEQIASQFNQITTDKNAPIHLYCRSGRRAGVALIELQKLGYNKVTNHGGYQDLLAKGIK